MSEINSLPWNGYSCVSTFSGCGGGCLGLKWAGFRVLWASEFIPAARDTYRANHPGVHVDERDIRVVTAEEVLTDTGMAVGEIDVLEGSPPCASFSTAGQRQKHWGEVKTYSDTKQRTDDLFFEFARLVGGIQPRVFVAENVAGLARGAAKGYFNEILRALRDCGPGYRVGARNLDAQWLGVPQHRERIFFVGVRSDLTGDYPWPKPLPYRYTLREALPWVEAYSRGDWYDSDEPYPAVVEIGNRASERASFSANGYVQVDSSKYPVEPETDISRFAIGDEYDRLKQGEQSDRYFSLRRSSQDEPSGTITQTGGSVTSSASVTHPIEKRKFSIAELRRVCGFPDDFVLTGTYQQQWERLGRAVAPPVMRAVAEGIREILDAQEAG